MQNPSLTNKQPRAVSRDKNYWREMVVAWKKSKEHPKDFCTRMDIKLGTFAHWRGIFNKEIDEHQFIPLRVTSCKQETLDPFIIKCPSGHQIVLTPELKMEQVHQIFKLLGLTA